MMGSYVSNIEYYLPGQILDNKKIEEEFSGWDSSKYKKKLGINRRHIADTNQTALDLAYEASEKLLKGYDRTAIDFLILCTQSPDYFLPTSACLLQDRLNLEKNIGAFDINLGCSGFVYTLAVAKGLICSGIAEAVLLVTSETYSKFIHPKDRGNRLIFGDGAAAILVEKSADEHVNEFVLGTDGSGWENLIVRNGAMRNRYDIHSEEVEYSPGNITTNNNLYMNGPAIFNFTIERIPGVIEEVLEKNRITLDQVDYFIFHQANKYMLDYLRNKLDIQKEKFYINMENTGNTVSATIPIALKDCIKENKIKSGDKVLLIGFGVGYSWGATIIEI